MSLLRRTCAVVTVTLLAAWAASSTSAALRATPNQEASKPVAQILTDVVAAVNGATSVHIVANGVSDGSKIAMDLQLKAGVGGGGSVAENGLDFRIDRIGAKAYFEGSASFWKRVVGSAYGAFASSLLSGRWIEASATSGDLASLTPFTDMKTLIDGILASHGKLAVGGTTIVDGQPAFALIDTTQGGTLYVAATGKPYPLEITPKQGSRGGAIRFEGWNRPVQVAAPRNPLDMTKLLGGSGSSARASLRDGPVRHVEGPTPQP